MSFYIKIKLILSSLLKYILFHEYAREQQWQLNSSTEARRGRWRTPSIMSLPGSVYSSYERVAITLPLAVPLSLGHRRSKWQAVGSLEENKTRTQVIHSFIIRPWQGSDSVVLAWDISSILLASSTCLLPRMEGIIRSKIFAHLQQLNHSTFDWVFKRFIGSDAYWVQRERCAEIWGFWSQIQVMYKEKSFSTMAASRALHLLKMAFMLLLHVVKSQIL